MTGEVDPILSFFTEAEAETPHILYTALGVSHTATTEELRKAYRKSALRCHPDKHSHKSEEERAAASVEFQKIGFSWAVLSDEKRKKRYDTTGNTHECKFADADEAGWEAYFEDLFERLDRKILDEDKARYQGSEEELEDLRDAYNQASGAFPRILKSIPHSNVEDEERFVIAIEAEINAGRLERTKKWTSTSTDDAGRKKRKREAERDAKAAEEAAKEMGVWDEFYGSGKKGKRAGDKGPAAGSDDALASLIVSRQRQRAGGMSALEEKYRKIEEEAAAAAAQKKKRKGGKSKAAEADPDELDDDAFAALQAKMFGGKGKKAKEPEPHPNELDDEAFAALQAKMFGNKSKKQKTK